MPNLHEIINSLNDENVAEVKEQLKTAADAQHGGNKQLYARAKKAEGFEQKDGKWVKKEVKPKETKPEANKPDELDKSDKALEIAQRALLNSSGYKASEQQDYVFEQAEKLKIDVSEIVNDDYHKSKLKAIKDKLEVQGNMPRGGGKGGGGASDSVEYWIAKGELPPDQELAEKVVEAKKKNESGKKQFSDTLYVG